MTVDPCILRCQSLRQPRLFRTIEEKRPFRLIRALLVGATMGEF